MNIIAKAPLRMSFFGGGTDILPFCRQYGGEILFSTINKYAYCKIESIDDSDSILIGESNEKYIDQGVPQNDKNIMLWAVLHELKVKNGGLKINVYSDVLRGTGLGGSSAQVAAIILAIYKWRNESIDKEKLAKMVYQIERNILKIQGGYQDPIATVYGGIGYLKIKNFKNFQIEKIKIYEESLRKLRESLVLYFTGMQHDSSAIIGSHLQEEKRDKDKSDNTMLFIKHQVMEARQALETGRTAHFGEMLRDGWEYKKKMCSQVSNAKIDYLYQKALNAGAIGGKILGAGGGGYLLLFCEKENQDRLKQAFLEEIGKVEEDWEFDFLGARAE